MRQREPIKEDTDSPTKKSDRIVSNKEESKNDEGVQIRVGVSRFDIESQVTEFLSEPSSDADFAESVVQKRIRSQSFFVVVDEGVEVFFHGADTGRYLDKGGGRYEQTLPDDRRGVRLP